MMMINDKIVGWMLFPKCSEKLHKLSLKCPYFINDFSFVELNRKATLLDQGLSDVSAHHVPGSLICRLLREVPILRMNYIYGKHH